MIALLDISHPFGFYLTEIQKLCPFQPTAERRENFGPLEHIRFHHLTGDSVNTCLSETQKLIQFLQR